MAKTGKAVKPAKQKRARVSLLTKVLLLALLVSIGWQLYRLHDQVRAAQVEKEQLASQVQVQQQKNDALSSDIATGETPEKMEELAREKLGLVAPGERVFYDTSN